MTLTLTNLSCTRGERTLFQSLDLHVEAGEVALVRGANGSGKTSLLRMIAGLLNPSHGSISWSGAAEDLPLQSQLHFLGHLDGIKPTMSVGETLRFWSAMKGGAPDINEPLDAWNLSSLRDLPCGILSAGQRRRVALAQLELTDRPLWLLDEPTGPLDEIGVQLVTAAISRHKAAGGVTLIATHRAMDVGDAQVLDLSARRNAA